MDVNESLEIIRQNSQNITTLLNHTNKPGDHHHESGKNLTVCLS